MKHFLEPFFVGSTQLRNRILYAPLAGCSDFPFRQMTNSYRPGITFCEMVKMDALIRNDIHTFRLLDFDASMHPMGAQLVGSKVHLAAPCARIIEDLGFDVLDFNCGCPVDKVTKDGSGSGMLKNPHLIGEILYQMSKAVKIPVTVKVRAGWDANSINSQEVTKIAEQAGAKAITIHGRTRAQGYTGPANWDYIKMAKMAAKSIPVIGNGDAFDGKSTIDMISQSGCDAVLIARGTLGRPWIVEDIAAALQGLQPIERSVADIKETLFKHFEYIIAYRNEKQALLDFRRVGCWYLKQLEGVRQLRSFLNGAQSTAQVMQILHDFSWESVDLQKTLTFEETQC